jgi:hypothetical protein
MTAKSFFSVLIALSLLVTPSSYAQSDSLLSTSRKVDQGLSSGTVYYSGNYPGAVLMRVNMLGEVQRPGVHHMPVDTDFNTALGFAGGPTRFANTKRAYIKRRDTSGKEEVINLNLNDHFSEVHREVLTIKPNDTLFIEQNAPIISDNTFRVIVTLSFIIGIVLSSISIHELTEK